MVYTKRKRSPNLNDEKKKVRFKWAEKHIFQNDLWKGAFWAQGCLELVFVENTLNAPGYKKLIKKVILPVVNDQTDHVIFQQDNSAVHTAIEMEEFWEKTGIDILDWPSCSPDLNPIENLWGWMVRKIYEGGKIYKNISDLKVAILEAWNAVPNSLITSLIESMPNRCLAVIKSNGNKTKY